MVLRFISDDDDFIYVATHLTPVVWYERIWNAVLYVLGKRSRWGDFEEYLWTAGHIREFRDFCDNWLKGRK
jgi:hypothetical protein